MPSVERATSKPAGFGVARSTEERRDRADAFGLRHDHNDIQKRLNRAKLLDFTQLHPRAKENARCYYQKQLKIRREIL